MLQQPLVLGVAISLLGHAVLLAIHFSAPRAVSAAPLDARLEVVLINARAARAPLAPEVLAQNDLEAGGDSEQGRAKSPLRAADRVSDGEAIRVQRRREEELQEQQRRLLTSVREQERSTDPSRKPRPSPAQHVGGDDRDVERAIARLEAQIDQRISDLNKRPRRMTFGVNARGVTYARYVQQWADRIERIGTERYPPEARGRQYDSLVCTVEIDRFGNVVGLQINRKSRYESLNRAVREIVYAGAPYAAFSDEMAREGDVLQIVRTWTFTHGSLATESYGSP